MKSTASKQGRRIMELLLDNANDECRAGDCAYVVERSADMVTWQRASWFVDADEAWFYDAPAQRMFYLARVVDVNEPLQ